MTTIVCTKPRELRWPTIAWLPLAVLPVAAGWFAAGWPAWIRMWLLAISIYAGFKWLTFATAPAAHEASLGSAVGYLLLWTGMDAESFFARRAERLPARRSEWAWAVGQTAVGVWILFGPASWLARAYPLAAGWLAMAGVVSVLHFGVSHVLSLAWQAAGVQAQHIMHEPLLATSLADFWGRRWNLAFRDLAHRFVLKPLVPTVGGAWAMMIVFLVSGLIHDAVISLTARGGWGSPTLYFLIQGVAVLLERSRVGRRVGLGRGLLGRFFAAVVVLGPVGLLFHPSFVTRVVLPMLDALGGVS
jgi:membrane bound O-acyltransferase family protein